METVTENARSAPFGTREQVEISQKQPTAGSSFSSGFTQNGYRRNLSWLLSPPLPLIAMPGL
jgi:hypothetical protein